MRKFSAILLILIFSAVFPVSAASSSNSSDSLADVLFDTLFKLIFMENFFVYYGDYPFSGGEDFIRYSDGSQGVGRAWHGEVETSVFGFPGEKVAGNQTRLDLTVFHILGILGENVVFAGEDDLNGGDFRLGLYLNFFQTNILSMSFLLEWSHIYGDFDDDGAVIGLMLRSYLARLLLLEWRLSYASYGDSDTSLGEISKIGETALEYPDSVVESHLEAGFMAGRIELFAAWKRFWADSHRKLTGDGFSVGAKVHF